MSLCFVFQDDTSSQKPSPSPFWLIESRAFFNFSKDSIEFFTAFRRSMSSGPRHHGPRGWTRDRGDAVRWGVRTLAQAFGAGYRRPERRDASRQCPRDGDGPGGENQDGSPEPRKEGPSRGRASRSNGSRASSVKSGEATGSRLPCNTPAIRDTARPPPRRGPPVAVVKVPGWHRPIVRRLAASCE